jgi:hypothetical protein
VSKPEPVPVLFGFAFHPLSTRNPGEPLFYAPHANKTNAALNPQAPNQAEGCP